MWYNQPEQNIVEEALLQLTESTGIKGSWQSSIPSKDGEITLTIDNKVFQATAEVKNELRQYQLPQLTEQAKQYPSFIVVADNIFPTLKENLRQHRISYLDTAGNIFIHTDQIYLWIDGKKSVKKSKAVTNRAFTKTGLRAVFFILRHPKAINQSYRYLAQQTRVSLGNIKNVFEGLTEAGFILQKNKAEKILHNKTGLLDRWIGGYRESLKPALHMGSFRFWNKEKSENWQTLSFPDGVDAMWGGEGAASEMVGYLNPQELTVYTDQKSALLRAWTLIPDSSGELHMYEKFWHDEKAQTGEQAPPLLVYADLLITDDPRCIATASLIYDKYLQDEFGTH